MQQQPASAAATQLLELPHECLVAVLQRVQCDDGDEHDCASVCAAARAHSRLHAAAAPALSSISRYMHVTQARLDSLQLYLGRHGQHVSSLSWDHDTGDAVELRQLPACSQLQNLRLPGMPMQLGASSSHQGVLQAVPALTRLQLYDDCSLLDTDGGALSAALACLTALRHLDLRPMWDATPKATIDVSALAQLQLTHLDLSTALLEVDGDGTLPRLNSLAHLRELDLAVGWHHVLPAGGFSGLQQLTKLLLRDGSMAPSALAGIPQLRHLELAETTSTGGDEGTGTWLQHLGQLQCLSHLELEHSLVHAAPSAAVYAALTASSWLERLELLWCAGLAPDAWQAVFSAGRPRPALRELLVCDCTLPSPRGVEAMVSACPGLQRLRLDMGDHSTAAAQQQMSQLLAPLSGLSQLVSLTVSRVDDAAISAGLAQLSGLRALSVHQSADLSMAGLLALTQLRGLTALTVASGAAGVDYRLTNQAPAGAPPDVWRQVLERCQRCDDPAVCLAARQAAAVEARLDEKDRRIEELQQQLAAHEQQVAGLQQQLAMQAAEHSQQLAARAAGWAQLAEQAAALAQLLQR